MNLSGQVSTDRFGKTERLVLMPGFPVANHPYRNCMKTVYHPIVVHKDRTCKVRVREIPVRVSVAVRVWEPRLR